jgi:nicotinamidase-related amidase
MRKIRSNLAVLIAFITFASPVFSHDYKKPEDAVSTYIKAVKTGSGKHIEMAFVESASIQYFDAEGTYQNYTRDAFAKLVNSGNEWDANIEITNLKVTGNAANATVEFTWGDNNQHGYVDYLNLINDGKSWHITDKVAQYIAR